MKITPLESWIAQKIGCSNQFLSQESLREFQLKKLKETIQRAKSDSSFYRKHLSQYDLREIKSLEDLVELPFTTPEQLKADPLSFLCVSQGEINRVVTLPTSGTTGEPKRVFFTEADQELTIDFFQIGMSTMVEPGDRVLILLPGQRPGSVGDLLKKGLARMQVEGLIHGPVVDVKVTLKLMKNEDVNCVVGIPTQVLALARHYQVYWEGEPISLKSVLLSTDHVPDIVVKALEETWNCKVYNHYGMTEMGLGGGVDCSARQGYHLREADILFEIINLRTGLPAADGEYGEVVFTTLTRHGMPLIRYRTGDFSRIIPGSCLCGSILRRMEHVKKRVNGGIELPGGIKLWLCDLNEKLFALKNLENFSAQVFEEKGKTQLRISYRPVRGRCLTPAEVIKALHSLPSISLALSQNTINLLAYMQEQDINVDDGTRKRIIADHRSGV
jgi:phenylacetate-CoA ligase